MHALSSPTHPLMTWIRDGGSYLSHLLHHGTRSSCNHSRQVCADSCKQEHRKDRTQAWNCADPKGIAGGKQANIHHRAASASFPPHPNIFLTTSASLVWQIPEGAGLLEGIPRVVCGRDGGDRHVSLCWRLFDLCQRFQQILDIKQHFGGVKELVSQANTAEGWLDRTNGYTGKERCNCIRDRKMGKKW